MTPVVLVQALGVKKINVRYRCMCDLDANVSMVFAFQIGNDNRRKFCDVLRRMSEQRYHLVLLDTNCNKLIDVYRLHTQSMLPSLD